MGRQRLRAQLLVLLASLAFFSLASCGGAPPSKDTAPKSSAGRHLQIVHAMTTSQRLELVAKLRERNPAPKGREWYVNEEALSMSLTVVDPFAGFLRRAKRRVPIRTLDANPKLDDAGAAEVARAFVQKNADLFGLPRSVVPQLAEHVGRVQANQHQSPYAVHVVRFEAPFPTKGYEAFHELDNAVDLEVFVDDDGEVSSFVNLSKIHPRLLLDTRASIPQDDGRLMNQLVGRDVFALLDGDSAGGEQPKSLREVRELHRLPLGKISPNDVTHVQLVVHIATGPQLAWLTYRLGYFIEIAKPAPAELFDPGLLGGGGPPFFFFRYVVDADTGDVIEDARAPMTPTFTGNAP